MDARNQNIESADNEQHKKLLEHIKTVVQEPLRYIPNVDPIPYQQSYEKDDEDLKKLNLNLNTRVEELKGSDKISFEIGRILRSFSVAHNIFPNNTRQLICTTKETTLSQAWTILCSNSVQSIPVLESGEISSDGIVKDFKRSGKTLGCVSMESILKLVTRVVKPEDFKNQQFNTMLERREAARKKSMSEIIDLEPLKSVKHSTTVFDAIKEMINQDFHRLMVVDDQNHLMNYITQSRIIQVIDAIMDSVPEESNSLMSLESLGLSRNSVITVDRSVLTIEAFSIMASHKVSSVALVDSKGSLHGVLTATDIKELGPTLEHFHMLGRPVHEFYSFTRKHPTVLCHKCTSELSIVKERPEVITATADESLRVAIHKLCHWRVHRLFIVENNKPIGCLALFDILKFLVQSSDKLSGKSKQQKPEQK